MRLQETIPSCISSMFSMSATVSRADFIISYSNGDSERENIDSIFKDTLSLAWKGYPLTFRFFYALITVIDLSSNHLQGDIPEGITQLSALVALNLSSNNLSGSIPSNIGQLQQLRFLDLSRNSLSGRIPASLSTVPFLTFLNLSFNNLFGEIPLGNQLQSFDAFTYTGNQGLCGPPLTQECPRDSITFDHHSDHHDRAKSITPGHHDARVIHTIRAVPRWRDRDCNTIIRRRRGQFELSDICKQQPGERLVGGHISMAAAE